MFSFPPENFLTALVPGFVRQHESAALLGPLLPMGNVGVFRRYRPGDGDLWDHRQVPASRGLSADGVTYKCSGAGNHTPLFALLYRFVPGFDHFRSHSKFFVQATPFVAVLTGQGMNQVLRSPRGTRLGAMLVFAAALILAAIGFFLWRADSFPAISETWHQLMDAIEATSESYLPSANYAAIPTSSPTPRPLRDCNAS